MPSPWLPSSSVHEPLEGTTSAQGARALSSKGCRGAAQQAQGFRPGAWGFSEPVSLKWARRHDEDNDGPARGAMGGMRHWRSRRRRSSQGASPGRTALGRWRCEGDVSLAAPRLSFPSTQPHRRAPPHTCGAGSHGTAPPPGGGSPSPVSPHHPGVSRPPTATPHPLRNLLHVLGAVAPLGKVLHPPTPGRAPPPSEVTFSGGRAPAPSPRRCHTQTLP